MKDMLLDLKAVEVEKLEFDLLDTPSSKEDEEKYGVLAYLNKDDRAWVFNSSFGKFAKCIKQIKKDIKVRQKKLEKEGVEEC